MDVDAFMDYTNRRMVSAARAASASEPAWDGFGGLVLIGESAVFREEGLFSVYSPLPPSSSSDMPRTKTAQAASTSQSVAAPEDSLTVEDKTFNTTKSSLQVQKTAATEAPKAQEKLESAPREAERREVRHPTAQNSHLVIHDKPRPQRPKGSTLSSAKTSPNTQSPKGTQTAPRFDHFADSDAEKFKSRLVAVRSEGLPAKETMIKCAGIADDAFRLAVKRLQLGEFADAFLLAEVAESACPASIASAKTKILSLKQSALKRLKKSVVVQS